MRKETMKSRLRQFITIATATAVMLAACGCGGNSEGKGTKETSPSTETSIEATSSDKTVGTRPEASKTTEYDTTVDFTWMLPTQQNIPVAQSAVMEAIIQKFNVNITFTELGTASQQFDEKKRLLIASRELPDVMTQVTSSEANEYGPQGAFLEIGTVLDQMPNLKKYLEEDWDGRYQAYSLDDRLFLAPSMTLLNTPIFDFGYNAEAAKSVGFESEPETWDDFYLMLKALKEKNPESYPLTFRGEALPTMMFRSLFVMSFTEGKVNMYNEHLPGYDYDSRTYINGVELPGYRDAIEFMNKLYSEGLIDPEFMTLSMDKMISRLNEEKSYVLMDYSGGLSGDETVNESLGGKIVPMHTPGVAGKRTVWGYRWSVIAANGTVINASLKDDPEKLERILAILDYLYSQEFYDLLYNNPDVMTDNGNYIDEWYTDSDIRDKYLPWSLQANFQVNYQVTMRPGTPYAEYVKSLGDAIPTDKFVPTVVLPVSNDMRREINNIALPLKDYFDAAIDNFIIGNTPMSEWDAFVTQIREKGGDQLAQINNDILKENLE